MGVWWRRGAAGGRRTAEGPTEEVLQERHEELESYVEHDEPQHEQVEQEEQDEGEQLHEVHTLWFGLSGAGKTSSPTWS